MAQGVARGPDANGSCQRTCAPWGSRATWANSWTRRTGLGWESWKGSSWRRRRASKTQERLVGGRWLSWPALWGRSAHTPPTRRIQTRAHGGGREWLVLFFGRSLHRFPAVRLPGISKVGYPSTFSALAPRTSLAVTIHWPVYQYRRYLPHRTPSRSIKPKCHFHFPASTSTSTAIVTTPLPRSLPLSHTLRCPSSPPSYKPFSVLRSPFSLHSRPASPALF